MSAAKTFMNSFFDGFTMSGMFGGLRVPGSPSQILAEAEPAQTAGEGDELRIIVPRGSLTSDQFQALKRLAENELRKRNAAGRVEVFKSQTISEEHHAL